MATTLGPMPMMSGSANNPTGLAGGSTTATGLPVLGNSNMSGTPGMTAMPGATSFNPSTVPNNFTAIPGASVNPVASTYTPPSYSISAMPVTGTGQTQRQQDRTLGELQDYYGEGVGSYIYNLMQNGGINMDLINQVNSASLNAMQGSLNSGSANLNAVLGAMGVSGNSSTNALANSQYWQNAIAQENAMINQNYMSEYNQGQQLLSSILNGVLNTNKEGTANESNWMDYLSGGISGLMDFSELGGLKGISGLFKT